MGVLPWIRLSILPLRRNCWQTRKKLRSNGLLTAFVYFFHFHSVCHLSCSFRFFFCDHICTTFLTPSATFPTHFLPPLAFLRFEFIYTYTKYYLAQVYKIVGEWEICITSLEQAKCWMLPCYCVAFFIYLFLRWNWACSNLLPQHPAEAVAFKAVQPDGVGPERRHAFTVLRL